MINKALHQPSAHFTHHKLKKAFPAPARVSNSFTAHKDDQGWGPKSQ